MDCWDKECSMGLKICCYACEAYHVCPESCDRTDCRGEEDEQKE